MRISQQEIKQRDRSCLPHTIGDDLRIPVEQTDELRRRQIQGDPDKLCQRYPTENSKPRAPFYAVILTRAKILADKRRHRH